VWKCFFQIFLLLLLLSRCLVMGSFHFRLAHVKQRIMSHYYTSDVIISFTCWERDVWNPHKAISVRVRVTVRVTLLLTVGQSVCLGVEPHLRLMTRCLLTVWQLRSCPISAPSLTRGRACLLSVWSLCQYIQEVLQFYMFNMNLYYTLYTRPLSAQARYSRLCPTSCG
jgi:hypothetical protein